MRKSIDWHTGEVSFDHDGRRWRLLFTLRAYAKEPGLLTGKAVQVTPLNLRRLLGLALAKHHPGMTEAETGDLVESIGLETARRVVRDAIEASQGHPWTNYWRNLQPAAVAQNPG